MKNVRLREQRFRELSKSPNQPAYIKNGWSEDNIIFLSASHATEHIRRGSIKQGEYYTALFIQDLQKIINLKYKKDLIAIMYKSGNPSDDPNFIDNSPYRNELLTQLKNRKGLFLDFHVIGSHRELDVDIETNGFKNPKLDSLLVESISSTLNQKYFTTGIDHYFAADKPNNCSNFLSSCCPDIKTIQIETNYHIFNDERTYFKYLYAWVLILEDYIKENL